MSACIGLKRAIWVACIVVATTAIAEGADVTLAWDPNQEPDVEGYRLSYGNASGQYTTSVDTGNTTTHTLTNLFAGQTYYFVLQAYNAAGLSAYSNEVSTTIASPLTVINLSADRPSPQPAGTTITFSAESNGGTPPHQYKWWIVSGAAETIGSNWSANSSFTWTPTAPDPHYTIRVWARNDGSTVDAPDNSAAVLETTFAITSGRANTPPTVNAGADQTVTVPGASLSGTVSDDGLPSGSVTLMWMRVSGPGIVTFSAPRSATTSAIFSLPGAYVLRLTASDGELSGSDDVVITFAPSVPGPVAGAVGLD